MSAAQWATIIAGFCAAALLVGLGWVVLRVLRQLGRLLLRVEKLETQAPAEPPKENGAFPSEPQPVRPGTRAPEFQLPDLTGAFFDLSDLRGHDTLLVFSTPTCGFFRQMLDELKAWERANPVGGAKLVLVSSGPPEANQALGLSSLILLDDELAVARSYGVYATPSAIALDSAGNVVSYVAAGLPAVLEVLRSR